MPLQISKTTQSARTTLKVFKIGSLFLLATALLVKPAFGESVKADPVAAHGCIEKVSLESAQAAMKRFNLHQMNARPSEVRTLGTALVYIEKLNGGKPPTEAVGVEAGYRFNFRDGVGASRQTTGEIQVTRNGEKRNGNNVAQLVHELGHYIGNNGGYAEYRKVMGSHMCKVSGYSDDRWNEQFAEVFAAFVTRPNKIKSNPSPACKTAFRFFANFFDGHAVDMAMKCMEHQDESED